MKSSAPAALRNRGPIADVLAAELPEAGLVLEFASGTGEHAVAFAQRFPHLQWQPSDRDGEALASIAAWRDDTGLSNLLAPVRLDAASCDFPMARVAAIVCINMVHISPWQSTVGLFSCAAALPEGAPLVLYGPYLEPDIEPAESNLAFDASLRARDPEWGLRPIGDLDALAAHNGLVRTARYAMPANNLTLVFRRMGHAPLQG